jgi:signal transduction histidine kinase/ligand-binding sensor domain-containing protein
LPFFTLLLVVLGYSACNTAAAQQLFSRLGVDDGLPNATIYSVQQDSTGFLWLGSTNSGLLRFDGYRFVEFAVLTEAELAIQQTPDVGVVLIDTQDNIWAGTWGLGLSKLTPGSSVPLRYTQQQGLAGNYIQSLLQDKQGRIWVGTTTGLSRINTDGSITLIGQAQQQQLADQRIWSLEQGADGQIWIGTSAGLHRWHDDSGLSQVIELVLGADSLHRGNEIRALKQVGATLWIGSRQGVFQFSSAEQRFIAQPLAGPDQQEPVVNTLQHSRDGQTLLIGSYNGLYQLATDSRSNAPAQSAQLSHVNVRSILYDRSGVLWLGTRESGLFRNRVSSAAFSDGSEISAEFAKALPFSVTAVLSAETTLWLGSTDMLYHINRADGQLQRFATGSRVNAMAQSAEGLVYVATDSGLLQYDKTSAQLTELTSPFELAQVSNRNVRDIKIAADGTLYLGLWGEGVIVWHPGRGDVKHWLSRLSEHTAGNAVQQLFLGSEQQLWVATRYSGLYQIDIPSQQVLQHSPTVTGAVPITHSNVLCVSEHQRILAVCNRNEVLLYDLDTGGQQRLTAEQGLPGHTVLGVLQQDERLWVMTAAGLALRHNESERFVFYNSTDGMLASELNLHAVAGDEQQLYFGSIAGLVVLKPALLQANRQPPQAALSAVVIDHQQRQLKPHATAWPTIVLSADTRTVNFEFSALDFQDPQRNQFHYRLEGVDADWVLAGARNSAFYANLPPGDYLLWLRASNNHGVFSSPQIVASLQVQPHWWQRKPVLYALLLGALALIWLLHQYRLRHVRQINRLLQSAVEDKAKAQLILETRVSERTQALEQSSVTLSLRTRQLERSLAELAKSNQELKQLDKLKDEFIATVSHELRTPLTAIRGAIGLVAQQVVTPDNPMYLNMLQTAQANSERLSQLINDLLDLQKFAAGTFTLNCKALNLLLLLQQALVAMQPYAKRYQVELALDSPGTDSCWVDADALRLRQVIDNLISNAIKFSPPEALVKVRLLCHNDEVEVEVEDQGAGIPLAFQQRVFEKFSQADSSDQRVREGSGLGLAICKKIITNHQGQIGFSSELAKGSVFWFRLKRIATP